MGPMSMAFMNCSLLRSFKEMKLLELPHYCSSIFLHFIEWALLKHSPIGLQENTGT